MWRVGISEAHPSEEKTMHTRDLPHSFRTIPTGRLFTESGGEMSRLNVLREDIIACGGSGDSACTRSGVTSQVFVMIV